jgi:hypothetical protein
MFLSAHEKGPAFHWLGLDSVWFRGYRVELNAEVSFLDPLKRFRTLHDIIPLFGRSFWVGDTGMEPNERVYVDSLKPKPTGSILEINGVLPSDSSVILIILDLKSATLTYTIRIGKGINRCSAMAMLVLQSGDRS